MIKTLSFLLLTLPAAAAAGPQEAPTIYAQLKPTAGAWAEYSYETKSGDKTKTKGTLRFSVVGKKGDSVWLEQKMTMQVPKPKKEEAGVVMKMLLGKDGVEKAYMKSSHGVMDMSGMMSAASRRKYASSDKAKMTEVGVETVAVPAGTFKATRMTFKEAKDSGDAWVKRGAGPYGMIKQVHRASGVTATIELLASGDDAKSEVDETTALSGPAGFGEMMARQSGDRPKKKRAAASGDAEDEASAMPSFGGMFKKALKEKAGLSGD